MELVRNKASGNVFVVLDEMGENGFVVITPGGKVKNLEKCLFFALDGVDLETPQVIRPVSEVQMEIYTSYFSD